MRPERYNVRESEQKWQKEWADAAVFATRNDDPRPKYYVLEMFPYPSGAGLHARLAAAAP